LFSRGRGGSPDVLAWAPSALDLPASRDLRRARIRLLPDSGQPSGPDATPPRAAGRNWSQGVLCTGRMGQKMEAQNICISRIGPDPGASTFGRRISWSGGPGQPDPPREASRHPAFCELASRLCGEYAPLCWRGARGGGALGFDSYDIPAGRFASGFQTFPAGLRITDSNDR